MMPIRLRTVPFGLLIAAVVAAPPAPTPAAAQEGPLFGSRDAWIASAYLGAAALAFPFDRAIAVAIRDSVIQETPGLREASRGFDLLGIPGAAILSLGLYGAGRAFDRPELADAGLHMGEAFVMAQVVTGVTKLVLGRTRPRRNPDDPFDFRLFRGFRADDFQAFPSGHTSGAFAVAAAAAHELRRIQGGSPWMYGALVYVPAGLVGLSRMFDNHHWASDVVFGAAIGAFSGWKTVRWTHDNPDNRVDRWFLGGTVGLGETPVLRLVVLPAAFVLPGR